MPENKNNVPIGKNEDVRYSKEKADREDLEAKERAQAADRRQERNNQ